MRMSTIHPNKSDKKRITQSKTLRITELPLFSARTGNARSKEWLKSIHLELATRTCFASQCAQFGAHAIGFVRAVVRGLSLVSELVLVGEEVVDMGTIRPSTN